MGTWKGKFPTHEISLKGISLLRNFRRQIYNSQILHYRWIWCPHI